MLNSNHQEMKPPSANSAIDFTFLISKFTCIPIKKLIAIFLKVAIIKYL